MAQCLFPHPRSLSLKLTSAFSIIDASVTQTISKAVPSAVRLET